MARLRRLETTVVLATLTLAATPAASAGMGASSPDDPPSRSAAWRGARLNDAVLMELNLARTQPRAYAEQLRRYRAAFEGLVAHEPDEDSDELTDEGVAAVDEAIAFLQRQRPLLPLSPAQALELAAADHAQGQGRDGEIGHDSDDGTSFDQRIERHTAWRGAVAEDISYGEAKPDKVVRQLIVDDGVADRGHRTNIFDPTLQFAGVGCGPHRVYRSMCVIDFAAELQRR